MAFSGLFQPTDNERTLLLPHDPLINDLIDEDAVVPDALTATQEDPLTKRRSGEGFDDVPESKRQLGECRSIRVTGQFR
jgi:hypothetical protein